MRFGKMCKRLARWAILMLVIAGLPATAMAQSGDDTSSGEAEDKQEDDEEESGPDFNPRMKLDKANRLAGRNALTRSVRHYRQVLKAVPTKYPSAYFNLASVYEGKKEWAEALFFFQAYRVVGRSPDTKKEAKASIERMKDKLTTSGKKVATLDVDVEPEARSQVFVDGFLVAEGGDLEGLEMAPGRVEVTVEVVDHIPETKAVELKGGTTKDLEMRPMKKTFHGTAKVSVNQEDATVKFKPKKLENPKGGGETVERTSPLEEPVELETGKWLLEVTKDDYHRWVRYIQIRRDNETSVDVEMEEKLPEEIR